MKSFMQWKVLWAVVLCAAIVSGVLAVKAEAADKVTLVVSIRGLDNPYHANYAEGAKALGEILGLPVDVFRLKRTARKVLLTSKQK